MAVVIACSAGTGAAAGNLVDIGRDPELFAIMADRLEPVIAVVVSR